MKEFKDQMHQTIRLATAPRRIVSLVPSQTQLLHYLGLEDEVVGITKFCIQPKEWFDTKVRVGGTKSASYDLVFGLQPDLIIGNKEENQKENIECLKKVAPVWMSDIYNLADALEMMRMIGEITEKSNEVAALISEIEKEFELLRSTVSTSAVRGKSVLYFIWNDPKMVAGTNTFVDAMLSECGLMNACQEERYPDVTNAAIEPDYVFLSSEPFPFAEKHIEDFQRNYPTAKIVLVDGEMFSWYGSKLKDAPRYFRELIAKL